MVIPKRLITLTGAGHLVFADICQLAPGQGGLLAAAAAIHLSVPASLVPLASDGCSAPDTPVTDEWPVVRQAVTAQLRWVFGFDATQAGLTGWLGRSQVASRSTSRRAEMTQGRSMTGGW